MFLLQEFGSQAPSGPGPALPTILEPLEPAGHHSTPQGLFVTSGCRGGGARLTGHRTNLALPAFPGEGRGQAVGREQCREQLLCLLGHSPKGPCSWPTLKPQGPLQEGISLALCFFTQLLNFCSVKHSLELGLSLIHPGFSASSQSPGYGRGARLCTTTQPGDSPSSIHSLTAPSHSFYNIY